VNVEVESRVVIRPTSDEAMQLHAIVDDLSSDFAVKLAAELYDVTQEAICD
jgi:hypothetical protein